MLQDKVIALEAQVQELQQQIIMLEVETQVHHKAQSYPLSGSGKHLLIDWGMLWLLPLVLLLIAHLLITVVFDLNLIYLRVLSLLIPLPFAFALMLHKRWLTGWIISAFGMAGLAVLGMSYVIYLVDGTPVLPQNMREVREFIEYASSIGFSYITGMMLGNILRLRHAVDATGVIHQAVALMSTGVDSVEKLQAKVQRFQKISAFITAASTAIASIYNGFKIF